MPPHDRADTPRPEPTAYVGRLAPAPTGALHVGNARTFLVAWLRARQGGGRLLLRMEDLDHPKVKPAADDDAYRDLAWLGLDWDEGADADPAAYQQSRRLAAYRAALDRLLADGAAYPCRCRRKDWATVQSAPQDGDPHEYRYPNTCRPAADSPAAFPAPSAGPDRGAAAERPPAWRVRLDRLPGGTRVAFDDAFAGAQGGDLAAWSGDFLVARDRDHPGYTLAVVVDDHAMGVTEVVRGDDLLPATQRQLALYARFGWTPPRHFHVPLVVGPDGRRLAKRHGDTRLSVWRDEGRDPGRLVAVLARSLGIDVPAGAAVAPADLVGRFDPARLPRERLVWTPELERRTR